MSRGKKADSGRFAKATEKLVRGQACDRVARRIGPRMDPDAVVGKLMKLYLWCWDHAPEGWIEGPPELARRAAERAMDWNRERGDIVTALLAEDLLRWAPPPPAEGPPRKDVEPGYAPPSPGAGAAFVGDSPDVGLHVAGWWDHYGAARQDRAKEAARGRSRRMANTVNFAEPRRKHKRRPVDGPVDSPRARPVDGPVDARPARPVDAPVDVSASASASVRGGAGGVPRKPVVRVRGVSAYDAVLPTDDPEFFSPPPPGTALEMEGDALESAVPLGGGEVEDCWAFIQKARAEAGRPPETARPEGFEEWVATVHGAGYSPEDVMAYIVETLEDDSLNSHATRTLINPAVWEQRLRKRQQPRFRL